MGKVVITKLLWALKLHEVRWQNLDGSRGLEAGSRTAVKVKRLSTNASHALQSRLRVKLLEGTVLLAQHDH